MCIRDRTNSAAGFRRLDYGLASSLADGEELWIIQREKGFAPATKPNANPTDRGVDEPGCGALRARLDDEAKTLVPLPLQHTDVKANVAGYVATVDVTQKFQNPFDTKIEAVYVFPLPQDAAIREFVMTIGKRRIRGIIKEKEEAERPVSYTHLTLPTSG